MWLQFFFSTTSPYAMNICIFIQINSLQPHDSNITCIKKQTWQRIDNQPKQTVSVSNSHTHTYTYSLFQAFKWKLLKFFNFLPVLSLINLVQTVLILEQGTTPRSWDRNQRTSAFGIYSTMLSAVLHLLVHWGRGGGVFQIPMERSKQRYTCIERSPTQGMATHFSPKNWWWKMAQQRTHFT